MCGELPCCGRLLGNAMPGMSASAQLFPRSRIAERADPVVPSQVVLAVVQSSLNSPPGLICALSHLLWTATVPRGATGSADSFTSMDMVLEKAVGGLGRASAADKDLAVPRFERQVRSSIGACPLRRHPAASSQPLTVVKAAFCALCDGRSPPRRLFQSGVSPRNGRRRALWSFCVCAPTRDQTVV